MIGVLVDGRYEVDQILGGGAFGQTFLAKDTKRPGRPYCVIKQLCYSHSNPKALEHARRLFKKEAEILEKLGHHDQIPTLLADIEERQEFYLVEQFIVGQSLVQEIIPGIPWTEEQVIKLLQEVLQILVFVHGQGVIHRDIKPANLMRRQSDGKLVLIDFGAVKELETQIAQGQGAPTIAIGTPGYMPIEQFNGQPQFNSDIYALGIIAIQALLGLAADELSGLKDHNSTPPGEVIWRSRCSVSPDLADLIDKMVRADCRYRYQSAAEVLEDLRSFGIGLEGEEGISKSTIITTPDRPTVATLPPTQQPRSLRHQRWMTAGLATVVALAGLAGIGYSQKGWLASYFYNQGREKARYGDISGALNSYNLAIQIDASYADAYARRCGTRLRLEDNQGAMEDCNRALALDANNAIAHLNWGNIYAEQRNKAEADKNYTRAVQLSSREVQLDPNNPDAYYHRGSARFRLGDYRGAIEDATQAIELDPDYVDAYVTRCQAHGLLSEHEQAVENCQQASEINPNHYVAFTSLCNNLSNSGRYDEAIEACTRALQINPNDPHAYNNRGVVWFRLKNYQTAIDDYNQAIQRDPNDAVAYHNLGDALGFQGDPSAAIDAYTKAIENNAEFAAAYYGRGIRQAELGNIAEAIADLQHSADLYSQQSRPDRAEDALYQVRRIQDATIDSEASEPPQSPSQPDPPLPTTEVSTPEASTSQPSSNVVEDPPAPAPAPPVSVIEEPPAPIFRESPPQPPGQPPVPVIQEPDSYVEEPPAPYLAPDIPADPYVEEPPAPYYEAPPEEPSYEQPGYEEPSYEEPTYEQPGYDANPPVQVEPNLPVQNPSVYTPLPYQESPSFAPCADGAC